jgi:hypothetical protein
MGRKRIQLVRDDSTRTGGTIGGIGYAFPLFVAGTLPRRRSRPAD